MNVLDEMTDEQIAGEARKAATRFERRPGDEHAAGLLTRLADRIARSKTAAKALAPFAEAYAQYERNNHLTGLDLIVRQDGRVLGHAGFDAEDLKKAHDAFVALGGKLEP